MDEMRRPIFVVALVVMVLVVIIEIGAFFGIHPPAFSQRVDDVFALPSTQQQLEKFDIDPDDVEDDVEDIENTADTDPPGWAIPYLALLDGLVLFTVLIVGLPMLVGHWIVSKLQGVGSLIVSIVVIIVAFLLAILALIKLLVMVAMFLAVPFGTIAYLAIFGFFDKGTSLAVLSTLLFLKMVFCVLLFLAQQRFLQNKGLVLIILTSLLANVIISFLHGIVPLFLVSITDAIAAIVVAILALIWALVMLVFSVVSVIRVLRVDRSGVGEALERA